MKQTLLIIALLFGCTAVQAQNLTPSTVKQVFSLEKGDSLEYRETTFDEGCGTICEVYRFNVIDSLYYSSSLDTLTILFVSKIVSKDSFALPTSCGYCRPTFWVQDYFDIRSGRWVIPNLDSNIKSELDIIYGSSCSSSSDTVYSQSSEYGGSKQTSYNIGYCSMIDFGEIYADSLGIVAKTDDPGQNPNNTEQLIYYHKANGKTWGTPYVATGIADVPGQYDLILYPNPANNKFVIENGLYRTVRFELYDIVAEKILELDLHNKETTVDRNNLSSGIYCWRMTDGDNIIKTGKLILE